MWFFGDKSSKLSFVSAALSDRGYVRPDNQDALVNQPMRRAFAVSDGMGGGEGGALASQWTCNALSDAFGRLASESIACWQGFVEEAFAAANNRIHAYATEKGFSMMGCTVALLMSDVEGKGFLAHVGDSRIYRVREGRIRLMTHDHTVGNELSRLSSARLETSAALSCRSRRNPLSHVLTRAIGTEQSVRAQWQQVEFRPDDRWLLCTDGVHDMLEDAEISLAIKRADSPEDALARCVAGVRKAGAVDNFSIICVFIDKN